MGDLTVLVNSTDSFEDCWEPFFKLFRTYWPDCSYPIVLNTETKQFTYPGLDIRSSRIASTEDTENEVRPDWSECLIRCLHGIPSEYVLYLQEDYFINAPVDGELITEFLNVMKRNNVAHIRLMERDIKETYRQSVLHPLLWEIRPKANYRIGLQAGLWRRKSLLRYLVPGESGWQFERSGTRRSFEVEEVFLCQNLDYFNRNNRYPISYIPTGIVKGQWYAPAIIPLFSDHGIEVDFSVRSIYDPGPWDLMRTRLRALARRAFMRCAGVAGVLRRVARPRVR